MPSEHFGTVHNVVHKHGAVVKDILIDKFDDRNEGELDLN